MHRNKAALTAFIVPLVLGLTMTPAQADTLEDRENPPQEETFEINSDVFVLSENDAVAKPDGQLYLMPESAENALIVSPEVAQDLGITEVGKVSKSKLKSVRSQLAESNLLEDQATSRETSLSPQDQDVTPYAAAQWTSFYTPPGGNWSSWKNRSSSLIGATNNAKHTYQWTMTGVSSQSESCGEGKGWYRYYVGGDFIGAYEASYGLGCGTSGAGTVPWEGVSAYPKFRSKASYLLLGGTGRFM